MTRVCFISLSAYGYFNNDPSAGGGAQRQLYLISTELTEVFDVHFIVGDYGQPDIEIREGVTLHRAYTPNRSASAFQRINQLYRLWESLRDVDADVYIVRCHPRKLSVLYPLITCLGHPLVYHVAADSFVERSQLDISNLQKKVYDHALNSNLSIVTQTPYQANQIQSNWNEPSTTIPNGYTSVDAVDLHKNREHYLWVGRLNKVEKRPHLFLDIAAEFHNQKFILIGSTDGQTEYADKIINRASDMENVKCEINVPPSEVHDFYRRAIAVINTSRVEGFPNTFLEAWRYATPVLSLKIDPKRFLKTDTECSGYASNDLSALKSHVDTLSNDTQKRKNLGKSGMKSFTKNYHLDTVSGKYERLLRNIMC
ncbi:glycosyltransferase family 4 protein [Halostagnicola bangensis]